MFSSSKFLARIRPVLRPDAVARRLRPVLHRDAVEREMDAELCFHLDMLIEQNVRRGMCPGEARRAALRMFGGVEQIKEECRDSWVARFVEICVQDVRYAVRNLKRTPGFTLVIVATLALGIGANAAMFSVVHGVLLRPLPFGGGDRLVRLQHMTPGGQEAGFSAPEIRDYRREATSFASLAEYHQMWFNLIGRGDPLRVQTGVVSAGFFDLLGVRALHGRTFHARDEAHDAPPVLVVSHRFWQERLGGDPAVIGRTFEMNDRAHVVVGVLPPLPAYPHENDVYMPTTACPFRMSPATITSRARRGYRLYGRLRDGVTLEQATADVSSVLAGLVRRHPDEYTRTSEIVAAVTPLDEELTRRFQPIVVVLLVTVAMVLLIACANVANLTTSRLIRRQRELAVRSALGASRPRLVRQLFTESILLAFAGGVAGLMLAHGVTSLLVMFAAQFTPRAYEIRIDTIVLLFTLTVSLITGLLFGVVPAGSRHCGGRSDEAALMPKGRPSERARNLLVVAQVAIAVALLVSAGLMIRSVIELQRMNPGFRTDGVVTLWLSLDWSRFVTPDANHAFYGSLLTALEKEPQIGSVAIAGTFPLNDRMDSMRTPVLAEGESSVRTRARAPAELRFVSDAYFTTMGVPIVRGRSFGAQDAGRARAVAIVSESMARRYWRAMSPIGRRFSHDEGASWLTVVGVAGDVRQQLDEEVTDEFYRPASDAVLLEAGVLIRTSEDPAGVARRVRAVVAKIDPRQPVSHVRSLVDVRDAVILPRRLIATLLGLFALLAVAIAATGVGGMLAFSVSQRTRELGIRLALGASRRSVLTLVMRQGMGMVLAGLLGGIAAGAVLGRVMSGLLFGVGATDPSTFIAVSVFLVTVATVTSYLPARRAATINPLVALRIDA